MLWSVRIMSDPELDVEPDRAALVVGAGRSSATGAAGINLGEGESDVGEGVAGTDATGTLTESLCIGVGGMCTTSGARMGMALLTRACCSAGAIVVVGEVISAC